MPRNIKPSKFYDSAALQLTKESFSITSVLDNKKGQGFVVTAVGMQSSGKTATILSLLKQSYHYFDQVHVVCKEVGSERDRYALVSATSKMKEMNDVVAARLMYDSSFNKRKILVVGDLPVVKFLDEFPTHGIVIYRTRDLLDDLKIQKNYIYLIHGLYKWHSVYYDLFDCGDAALTKQVEAVAETLQKERTVLVSQNVGEIISVYMPAPLSAVPWIQAVKLPIHDYVTRWVGLLLMGGNGDAEREGKRILEWYSRGTRPVDEVSKLMFQIQASVASKGTIDFVLLNKLRAVLEIQ